MSPFLSDAEGQGMIVFDLLFFFAGSGVKSTPLKQGDHLLLPLLVLMVTFDRGDGAL